MMSALAAVVIMGDSFRWAGIALVWYDEVAAVQLAWLTYYGSAYAALKGGHISVQSILRAFPLGLRRVLFFITKFPKKKHSFRKTHGMPLGYFWQL